MAIKTRGGIVVMGSSDGWCSEWSDLTQGTGSRKDSKASYWLDPGVVSDPSTEGR